MKIDPLDIVIPSVSRLTFLKADIKYQNVYSSDLNHQGYNKHLRRIHNLPSFTSDWETRRMMNVLNHLIKHKLVVHRLEKPDLH